MPLFYFCLLLLTIIAEGRNPGCSQNDLQTIPNILSDLGFMSGANVTFCFGANHVKW